MVMAHAISKTYLPKRKFHSHPDYVLLACIGILVFFGFLFLASASSIFSYTKFGNTYYMLYRQVLFGLIPGLSFFYVISHIEYRRYQKYTYWFYAASIILLLLVFVPGLAAEYGTSRSWITVFGFSFQPSELVKITYLIFLAGWIQKMGYSQITDLTSGLLPFMGYLSVVAILMVQQPDIGLLMVIVFSAFSVYFVAGAKIWHLAVTAVAAMLSLVSLIVNKPYIINRIKIFLDPALDTQNLGYQVYQAFLAIGSGGLLGRGFGKSTQKFSYLPEVSSDSIFAVIAEEMGFIVVVLLIVVYIVVAYRGMLIAKNAPDPFGRFLAVGIASWLMVQTFLNIAVMTGLVPVTGVTLPFISAGGSSLLSSLAAMGILVNISKYQIE